MPAKSKEINYQTTIQQHGLLNGYAGYIACPLNILETLYCFICQVRDKYKI